MGEDKGRRVHVALQSRFQIAGEIFYAVFVMGKDGQLMLAGWKNREGRSFALDQVTEKLHVPLPDSMNFRITMVSMDISYYLRSKALGFRVESEEYGRLSLQKTAVDHRSDYRFEWTMDRQIYLSRLPVIGKYMTAEDRLVIEALKLHFRGGEKTQFQFGIKIDGLGQKDRKFQIGNYGEENVLSREPDSREGICRQADIQEEKDIPEEADIQEETELPAVRTDIHWLELKKDLGIFHFHKLGFSMEGGKIRLYLNAGFTLSILEMEFIELYFSMAFEHKIKTDFGLKGMAVYLDRPPIYLSGGLYHSGDGLYNGMLTVRFQKFSLLALASYGKLPGSGQASFFAYLAVSYPLGGTPAFFVNGLAAGLGMHRRMRLPDLEHVRTFPLIEAVMGKGHKIEDAAEALEDMGSVIYVSEGNYFVSAGIRFSCFGMIDAFALLNIQFGARTEISLLGLADASLPAKVKKPIAFIRLALRLVFAPEDGIFQLSGALTQDSYLLDHNCRLQGGFALYTWFKGEHKGDFVLSAGGYHPSFHRSHYPSVDRVGVNWIISRNLTLKGEAYFALTPNCLMAGGKLEILYTAGKLKAWCRAYADILIGFRPFHYDIEIGVSLGASYRVDFLFVHKTFTLEIGADLRIRGPEFSGYVHVKWFIISFTIYFGKTDAEETKLDWKTFAGSFLEDSGKVGAKNEPRLCSVQAADGLLGQKGEVLFLNGSEFVLEVQSRMPCSRVQYEGSGQSWECRRKLGILPMKLRELKTVLSAAVRPRGKDGERLPLRAELLCQNMPAALWDTEEVNLKKDMLKDIPTGLQIRPEVKKRKMLPEVYTGKEKSSYRVSDLTRNHEIFSPEAYAWNPKEPPKWKNEWAGKKGVELMEATLIENPNRGRYLGELAGYGVYSEEEVEVTQYKENLRTILWAAPMIRRTGSRADV